MSRLVKRLRREPTTPGLKTGMQTFNAPGVYQPKFGKVKVYVSGRGESGNAPTSGTVKGYNPVTPGTYVSTNPSSGGNYVSTNPPTGGNYANTNPTMPGTVKGYNPIVPGNYAGTNPPTGGNISGYNPSTPAKTETVEGSLVPESYLPGNTNPESYTPGNYVAGTWDTIYKPTSDQCPVGWRAYAGAPSPNPMQYGSNSIAVCQVEYPAHNNSVYTASTTNPVTKVPAHYNPPTTVYTPAVAGNAIYNPGTVGNAYYNASTGGNAYYNPTTGGTKNYNPVVPGTANYNPTVPGNANYNTPIPGNAVYNPTVPGNVGTPYTTLGVYFPGGPIGSVAPQVGDTLVPVPYVSTGIPVEVKYGGVVIVKEQ
jgi:hypothetical protein